jgi:hypothetical protein
MEEKVQRIIRNLKEAQAQQKSYAHKRRQPLYFQVEDYVYLKVSPMKGVSRFGVKGKPDSPTTQGKPRCICHLLAVLNSLSLE